MVREVCTYAMHRYDMEFVTKFEVRDTKETHAVRIHLSCRFSEVGFQKEPL